MFQALRSKADDMERISRGYKKRWPKVKMKNLPRRKKFEKAVKLDAARDRMLDQIMSGVGSVAPFAPLKKKGKR